MTCCVSEDCRVAPGEPYCLERRKVVENRKNRAILKQEQRCVTIKAFLIVDDW